MNLVVFICLISPKFSACVIKSEFLSCFVSKDVWHSRLGHPANQVLKLLKGSLKLTHIDHGAPCDVCHKAKQTRDPFPLSEHKTSVFGDLIHSDVWGPYKVVSREGFRYFLTIVDDFSRSVWVYMLKGKHEVFEMFQSLFKMVLTQFNTKIKIVRSDNGTEFVNNKMGEFFDKMGIIHQTSVADTPQQNGIDIGIYLMLLEALCFRGDSSCVLA